LYHFHLSGLESCSLPRVDHIGPNWVTILVCLFSFLLILLLWLCLWWCFTHSFRTVLLLLLETSLLIDYHSLCSTYICFHWCDFVRIHNTMTFGIRGVNYFQLLRFISLTNRGNGNEGKYQNRSENTKLLCVEMCEEK